MLYPSKNKVDRGIILIFLSVILYFGLLITLLSKPPAKEYEISIYSVYPLFFWVLTVLTLTLIFRTLFFSSLSKVHLCLLIFLVCTEYFTLLLLPVLRGYFIFGRYDVLVHLGKIRDIISHGHVGLGNFYPLMHILVTQLTLTSDIEINEFTMILPPIFSIFFIIFYTLFIRSLRYIHFKMNIVYLLVLTLPLGYWHTSMVPNIFSWVMGILVLVLWRLYEMESAQPALIPIVVLYFALVFYHPLTFIYLLAIFAFRDIATFFNKRSISRETKRFYPKMPIAAFSAWMVWYFSFEQIRINFKLLLVSILNFSKYKNIFFKMYTSAAASYNLTIQDLIKFSVFRYSIGGIVSILSAIIFFTTLLNNLKAKSFIDRKTNTSIVTMWIALSFTFFWAWLLINILVHFVNFERVLKYVVMFGIPIVVYYLSQNKKMLPFTANPKVSHVIVVAIILSTMFVSIFSLYRSPYNGFENFQVSRSEYFGWGFFFKYRDNTLLVYDDGKSTQGRFYIAWFGEDALRKTVNIRLFLGAKSRETRIPNHFGYYNYTTIGEAFSKQTYFMISDVIKELYAVALPSREESWPWTPDDFLRLSCDPTTNRIYDNNDIETYVVVPKGDQK